MCVLIYQWRIPTIFFCNLENKNFVSKTIKKLVINENVVVDDQKKILKQTKQFYEKLYKKQDCLKKVNLSPTSIQKNLKKSAVKPSDPGLLLFFMRFNADVNSGKLISPSNDCF
jgi:hypothetical protein